jgi:hypothetical protein
MKLEFSRQFPEKCSNIKYHENPSSGSRVVPCGKTYGRTDMTKLIVAFRNFANAPKNSCLVICPCVRNHYYRHLSEPRIIFIFSNTILTPDFFYLLVRCSVWEYCSTVQIWQKYCLRFLYPVRNGTVP